MAVLPEFEWPIKAMIGGMVNLPNMSWAVETISYLKNCCQSALETSKLAVLNFQVPEIRDIGNCHRS
jgi:hypothetical protein